MAEESIALCDSCGHWHYPGDCDTECVECQVSAAGRTMAPIEPKEELDLGEPLPKDPNFSPIRGNRRNNTKKYQAGRFAEDRAAWVETNYQNFVLYVGADEEDNGRKPNDDRGGVNYYRGLPPINLSIRQAGKRYPVKISLTSMTEAELRALKDFLNIAIDKAISVSTELDKRAQVSFDEEGDILYTRLYRTVPQVYVRERSLDEYVEGLPLGSDGVVDRDGRVVRLYRNQRPSQLPRLIDDLDVGGALHGDIPHDAPADVEPEHSEPEASSFQEVRRELGEHLVSEGLSEDADPEAGGAPDT